MSQKWTKRLCFIFSTLMLHTTTWAGVTASGTLFSRGQSRATFYGSSARGFDQTYFVLGLGIGTYVFDGVQLGLDAETWMGADPSVYKLTPQILYVISGGRTFPYVGGFYRRTFIENLPDLDSYGGRAGIFTLIGERVYAGAGVVYERYAGCDEKVYDNCSSVYPEFNISFAF